jgi:hypothetical protein
VINGCLRADKVPEGHIPTAKVYDSTHYELTNHRTNHSVLSVVRRREEMAIRRVCQLALYSLPVLAKPRLNH